MLDAHIIDAIRRQERARSERGRVWLELPLEYEYAPDRSRADEDATDSSEEHVIIIPRHDPDR